MYKKSSLLNYLYLDIETIPAYLSFDAMPAGLQKIWLDKYHTKEFDKEVQRRAKAASLANFEKVTGESVLVATTTTLFSPTVNEVYIHSAGLYPEFSKIFCITFGVFGKKYEKIINTLQDEDEKVILEQLLEVLKHYPHLNIFGYNIAEFDIPFIIKRLLINGLVDNYPPQLQLGDSKPWTVQHVDHMINYKGAQRFPITLDLLCEVFGIESPKVNFSNAEFGPLLMAGKISVQQGIEYCEGDVSALMDMALKNSSENSNYFPEKKAPFYKKDVTIGAGAK